ncbi:MAG: cyclic nucleotide-binding domain-containing protein [Leptospirales bacterium]|jgi:CRP-like cAMP-binding protein
MQLKETGTGKTYRIDEVIYRADYLVMEPCVYMILSGEVDLVHKYNALQKEVFSYTQGDIIGALEVYTGSERLTQAVARTEVQVICFTRDQFEKNMIGNLKFALIAIRNLSKMLRQINGRIKKLE